uniref:Uncharacterized protein n=1 Tax=Oryza meridionalis TaxID=40149 RepID=A0A0E0DC01_9ORYZ
MDRWATRRCAAIDSLAHGMDNVLLGKVAARGNLPCLEKIADGEVDKEVTIDPVRWLALSMESVCMVEPDLVIEEEEVVTVPPELMEGGQQRQRLGRADGTRRKSWPTALVAPTMATDGPSSRSGIRTVDDGRRTPPPAEDGSAGEESGTGVVTIGGGSNGGGMVHGDGGGWHTAVEGGGGRRCWGEDGRSRQEGRGRGGGGGITTTAPPPAFPPHPSFLRVASLSPLALTGGGCVAPVRSRIRRRRKPCCRRMGWERTKGEGTPAPAHTVGSTGGRERQRRRRLRRAPSTRRDGGGGSPAPALARGECGGCAEVRP